MLPRPSQRRQVPTPSGECARPRDPRAPVRIRPSQPLGGSEKVPDLKDPATRDPAPRRHSARREAEGEDGSGIHHVQERAPCPRKRGAGGGVQPFEHHLEKEVGEPLEQVEQRRNIVVVGVVVVVVVTPGRERERGGRGFGAAAGRGVDVDIANRAGRCRPGTRERRGMYACGGGRACCGRLLRSREARGAKLPSGLGFRV